MAEQTNLGKKVLITGILVGIALAGWGIASPGAGDIVKPSTSVKSGKENKTLGDAAKKMRESMQQSRKVADTAPKGATINGEPRLAPLFFSTELWQVAVDEKKANMVIDIYDPAATPIHADVPNTWFITNGISDALGRADGLDLDSDNDGFTNGEEYKAQTKPADPASHPALLAPGQAPKMVATKVSTAKAVIGTDSMYTDPSQNPTEANIRIFSADGKTQVHKATVKVGESFGLSPKDAKRFTLVGYEKKQFPGFSGDTVEENVIKVRDNETAGAEKEFTVRAGTPNVTDKADPAAKGHRISDTTATLRLTAGKAMGTTVKAQLHASFTIPGGAADGKDLKAVFEGTDPAGAVLLKPEGAESAVSVPKVKEKAADKKAEKAPAE